MKAKKIKGFMVLPAVLMSILLGLLGLSFLQIYSGQFSALSSNRTAIQAQQFAQSEADRLRNTAYDSLSGAAHARTAISGGNGWQSLVSLGAETTVNEVKQRMATVNVYRNSTVTTPDFSLQVPLSSAGSGGSGAFGDYQSVGWSGSVSKSGFLLIHRDDSGYSSFTCKIDGVTRGYGSGDGSYGGSTHLWTIPISKGSSYSVTGNHLSSISFIPFK